MTTHKDCSSFPCYTTWGVTTNPTMYVMFNSTSWASATFDWEFEFEVTIGNSTNNTEIKTDYISVNEVDTQGNLNNITNKCSFGGTVPQPTDFMGYRGTKYHILALCQSIQPSNNKSYMLVKYKPVNGTYVGSVKIISGTRTATPNPTNNDNDVVTGVNNAAKKITDAINKQKQAMLNKFNEITSSSDWQNQSYNNQSYNSQNPSSQNGSLGSAEGDLESNYGIGDGSISGYANGASIHENASRFIWTTIRKCVDQTPIFTLIITILFLGVIATILNR